LKRARPFPWLLAGLGALGVYLATRPGTAAPPLIWRRKSDNWMMTGGHYRWSAKRYGQASAAIIAAELAGHGFMDVTVWQDTSPSDWPADDRALGRNRIEVRATQPGWMGDAVDVWSDSYFSGSSAPPFDKTAGNRLALLAQGTLR
jgi:hypothetical protein